MMIFEVTMAQAATLSDAQIKRALRWCTTRRYVTRDSTILLFSLYTGLRAKELAALRIGDVYDAEGTPRTQFTLSAAQTKGSRTRVVFVNTALSAQLVSYAQWRRTTDAAQPLFRSQRQALLSQHHVSAVPQHLQSMWAQWRKQPFGTQNFHYTAGEQRRGCACVGSTGRTQQYCSHTTLHWRKWRTVGECCRAAVTKE